jgi:RecB family exonuclease
MATLVLVTGTQPTALLEAAAADFLVPRPATATNPWPTPPTWLVLRQGGLRDDLLRLAAARGLPGWFDPPLALFAEIGRRLAPTLPRAVDALERRLLVEEALRHVAPTGIGRSDRLLVTARETDALIGELIAEGYSADAFAVACARRGDRDAFQQARDEAVIAAWRRVAAGLAARGMRDGRDTLAQVAATVASEPDALAAALGGRRALHIVGSMDLKGGWRPLLRALQASPALDRVALYTMQPNLLANDALVPDATERAGDASTLAARLFTTDAPPRDSTPVLTHWDMPDDRRALESVAVRVRRLVDAGTPPHRIAVVAREPRPMTEQAADALHALGLPVTVRRRIALTELSSVRLVRLLLEGAAERWTRHALVEVAEHPLFRHADATANLPRLDAADINALGYEQPLIGLDAWRAAMPASFASFADQARALDDARPLRAWVLLVLDMVRRDTWKIGAAMRGAEPSTAALAHADLRGWRQLGRLLDAWHTALADDRDATSLSAAEFLRLFDAVVQGDLATPPASAHGVHVSEALAVAYREFDHVFVVGMDVGRFPRLRMPGQLLDDDDREALMSAGVPLEARNRWADRERELLRAVVASAGRTLTVLSSRTTDGGRESVVSSFVEALERAAGTMPHEEVATSRVCTPAFPLAVSGRAVEQGAAAARIERGRLMEEESPWHGTVHDDAVRGALTQRFDVSRHVWSPTSLESLAVCGFQWVSRRLLNLETLEDPDDDASAAVRGTVLHDALRRFFDGERDASGGAPVLLTMERLETARDRVTEAFRAAFDAVAAAEWLGAPALRAARQAEWLRIFDGYLQAEAAMHSKWMEARAWQHKQPMHTGVLQHEMAFGPLDLDVDGLAIRVRGTMDRVEVGVDERLENPERWRAVVDYKSTEGSVPGGGNKKAFDDGVVVQLPLYGLVLTRLYPEIRLARLEYRTLNKGESKLALRLGQFDSKGAALEPEGEDHERFANAVSAVRHAAERAMRGDFAVRPAPSAGCSPYCVARDICRIPGGPRDRST